MGLDEVGDVEGHLVHLGVAVRKVLATAFCNPLGFEKTY